MDTRVLRSRVIKLASPDEIPSKDISPPEKETIIIEPITEEGNSVLRRSTRKGVTSSKSPVKSSPPRINLRKGVGSKAKDNKSARKVALKNKDSVKQKKEKKKDIRRSYHTRSIASAQRILAEGPIEDSISRTKSSPKAPPKLSITLRSSSSRSRSSRSSSTKRKKTQPPKCSSPPSRKRLRTSKESVSFVDSSVSSTPTMRITRSRALALAAIPEYRSKVRITALPTEMMCTIFGYLTTRELIKCRRVCTHWRRLTYTITSWVRVLSLNITSSPPPSTKKSPKKSSKTTTTTTISTTPGKAWEPRASTRSLYFQENVSLESPYAPLFRGRMCINERRLNAPICNALGGLFPNLHSLVIYFDLIDSRTNLIKLLTIIRSCAHVRSFSFVMSKDVKGGNLLPTMCAEIDAHMKYLTRLDLYVSDQNYIKLYEFQLPVRMLTILDKLEHFSISCSPQNFYDMLIILGQRRVMKSLSVQCRLHANDIPRLFGMNRNLVNVTQLQLTCVWNREMVGAFVKQFYNVTCLQLGYCRINWETFDADWIRTVSEAKHLTDLKLFDYSLDAAGTLIPASLPRVKRLTLGSRNLFTAFKQDARTQAIDCGLFVDVVAHQFPALEVLSIYATVREDAKLGEKLREAMEEKLPKVKLEAELDYKAWVE